MGKTMIAEWKKNYVLVATCGFLLLALVKLGSEHLGQDSKIEPGARGQIVYLNFEDSLVATTAIRESLRRDGLSATLGSDEALNAVVVFAEPHTTLLVIDRLRAFDAPH